MVKKSRSTSKDEIVRLKQIEKIARLILPMVIHSYPIGEDCKCPVCKFEIALCGGRSKGRKGKKITWAKTL